MDEKKIKALMSEPDFVSESDLAALRGKERMAQLPKARSARVDVAARRLVLEMESGITLLVPINMIQGLQTTDAKALGDFKLVLNGTQIRWETLDLDFTIESFLSGVFGSKKWMAGLGKHLAEIGRKGGQAKTPAKRAASAENGKKGGRPPKEKRA